MMYISTGFLLSLSFRAEGLQTTRGLSNMPSPTSETNALSTVISRDKVYAKMRAGRFTVLRKFVVSQFRYNKILTWLRGLGKKNKRNYFLIAKHRCDSCDS